jgi:hypothetical protein
METSPQILELKNMAKNAVFYTKNRGQIFFRYTITLATKIDLQNRFCQLGRGGFDFPNLLREKLFFEIPLFLLGSFAIGPKNESHVTDIRWLPHAHGSKT